MNTSFLNNINLNQLKELTIDQLNDLAGEIRSRILRVLSVNGGHLSSNLGIVELTIALHAVYNSPHDKMIFDTSHQTYTHKILTGRNGSFDSLRQYKGLSGFSHPQESVHDHFYAGHAGATLSTALGLAKTRDLNNENFHVLPVMGDASFTCGLIFEALNNIPSNLNRFVAVLNDNNMAISKNVGNIKNILSRLINNPTSNKLYLEIQEKLSKIPNIGNFLALQGQKIKESIKNLFSSATLFEQFGLTYIGPIDGHDIKKLIDVFTAVKNMEKPVIIHVLTTKGKGLLAAKQNPTSYHGVKSFNPISGEFFSTKKDITFPQVFGKEMIKMAKKDPSLVVISPAMLAGSSLTLFKEQFPERCFDVGIAEGHCVTYAGGMAYKGKNKVVVSIYSSFMQRSFDNIFHDICLQRHPVVFAIDRAGLSGPDGATHHGIYDIGFLNSMPNIVIAQPRNGKILKKLLNISFSFNRPTAIRYPNLQTEESDFINSDLTLGKAEILKKGQDLLIIPLGHLYKTAFEISEILKPYGINPTIVDPVFLKPLDSKLFSSLISSHKYIITIEEHSIISGLGAIINSFIVQNRLQNKDIINFGIKDDFVQHGKNDDLLKELNLDAESIAKKIIIQFDLNKPTLQLTK